MRQIFSPSGKTLLLVLMLLFATINVQAESCSEMSVRIENFSIFTEALNRRIEFSVFVPPCMDKRMLDGYPVLYLLHGQDMGRSVWQEMGLQDVLKDGINDGELPLFLVVTPQEDNYLASLFDSGYGRALIESLLPWVDAHYNTCTRRECRAVGGISRGALWAEMMAFEYPDLFASLGLHSMPGTIYDDQSLYALAARQTESEKLRIRMDVGNQDNYRHEGEKAADQLNFIGYEFVRLVNKGGHDLAYWSSQLPDALRWYSENW